MKTLTTLLACLTLQGCATYAEALRESRKPENQIQSAISRMETQQYRLERELKKRK